MTLDSVNEFLSGMLDFGEGGEISGEKAVAAVDTLGTMLDATSGGAAGSDVAGALVAGIETLGGALLDATEVGAPAIQISSADGSVQVSVSKVTYPSNPIP